MAKKNSMKPLDYVTIVLLVVGGINWGLIGAFKYDLVEAVFGSGAIARIVYGAVGLSGLYGLFFLVKQALRK